MATEKQARYALRIVSEKFVRLGAHSIGIEAAEQGEGTGFVLVAYVAAKRSPIPKTVTVAYRGKDVTIPVKLRRTAPFKAEFG